MKRRGWILTAIAAFLAGAAVSLLKLRYQCRDPMAEACVWGKAYFPLALPLETLVFGLLVLGAAVLVRRLRRRASGP